MGSGGNEPTCGPICWAKVPLPAAVRASYIVVDLPETPGNSLREVVAYGTPAGPALPRDAVTGSTSEPRLLRDFFGANVVGAVSGIANLSAVGHARMCEPSASHRPRRPASRALVSPPFFNRACRPPIETNAARRL